MNGFLIVGLICLVVNVLFWILVSCNIKVINEAVRIYTSIGIGMVLIAIYWVTEEPIVEEIAIGYFIAFFTVIINQMIVLPLYLHLFSLKDKKYKIKKGEHYSGYRFKPFIKKNKQRVEVLFNESCRYYGTDQVNKLFGFGSIFVHKNSHRIGWRFNVASDSIELFTYTYVNKKRTIEHLKFVDINKKETLELKSDKNYYLGANYFPYFGGKVTATHDVVISIKYLD